MGPFDFASRVGRENPDNAAPEDVREDVTDSSSSEPHSEEGEPAEEELELPGAAALTGISIRRKKDGMAKPAVQPTRPVAGIVRSEQLPPRDIAEYWARLRKTRSWPGRNDVDPKQIALHWPNTVLIRVATADQPWRFEPLISGLMRGGGQSFHNGEIEFNSMVMDWILSIGKNVEKTRRVVEDSDTFPTNAGNVRYRAMAVPLGDSDAAVNYVLCHVKRV